MKQLFSVILVFPIFLYAQPNHLVISQVYGGGGNNGASFTNDFIELFNPGPQAVNLNGYSVQYSSSTGTSWSIILLNGQIGPSRYYLIQLAGGASGATLPIADQVSAINLSASSGKIALVNSNAAALGSCPSLAIIDFLGHGTANCFEASGAPAGGNALALKRKAVGCIDSDNNLADFVSGTPSPRNSLSPEVDCSTLNSNLPVHFFEEKISWNAGGIIISWSNESESGVEKYEVERSENGQDFIAVLSRDPLKNDGGAARYQSLLPYQWGGYYRIKAMESNGVQTFSRILKGPEIKEFPEIQVFPNPGYGKMMVSSGASEAGIIEIIVTDMQGRIILKNLFQHTGGLFQKEINTEWLKHGMYFLIIHRHGEPVKRTPIIILK